MALYQPTNVIPSSYTKGTVDVNDKMEISWQVNGNSAMTAFQIDFYENDYASTYVTSTGKQAVNNFYGTDRFGRPQFFTWSAGEPWNVFDGAFTNGNEYKYKITQWYEGENEVIGNITANVTAGTTYYFVVPTGNTFAGGVVYFTAGKSLQNKTFFYSLSTGQGWYKDGNEYHFIAMSLNINGNHDGMTALGGGTAANVTGEQLFIVQTTSNTFITRDKPTLTIYRCSTGEYSDEIDFPNNGNIATSIGFFKAVYTQLQDDPIRWIRWQVATATYNTQTEKWVIGDILQDTGDIYTPTLNYEFNGFFNGAQYAIRAIGESESGQECNSDWVFFTINVVGQGNYTGEFTVQCLNKENAALLEWEGVEVIPPTTNPQGYKPQISNGSVTLNGKDGDTDYSVTWDEQTVIENDRNVTKPMIFEPSWIAAWKAELPLTTAQKTLNQDFTGTTDTPSSYDPITDVGVALEGVPTSTTAILSPVRVNPDEPSKLIAGNTYQTNFTVFPTSPYVAATLQDCTVYDAQYISAASRANPDGSTTQIITTIGIPQYVVGTIAYTGCRLTGSKVMDSEILSCTVTDTKNVKQYDLSYSGNTINYEIWANNLNETQITCRVVRANYYSTTIVKNLDGEENFYEYIGYTVNSYNGSLSPQVTYENGDVSVTLFSVTKGLDPTANITIKYLVQKFLTSGKLFNISTNNLSVELNGQALSVLINNVSKATLNMSLDKKSVAVIISPQAINIITYGDSTKNNRFAINLNNWQQSITSVSIYGGDSGATIDSVSVYQGDGSNILSLYENPDFEPVWNSPDYALYMTANFNGNLEGGTGTATGSGFRVYRQEVGKNVLTPIATVSSLTTSVKDYGIVSRKAYKYSLYTYDNNGAFMSSAENEKVVATCFKNYSLLVCDYDETNDEYHVRKQYLFALNLSTGSVGNNNSPTLNKNFTPYPTRMPDTANYKNGTLVGLIGTIYTVPALIEQIGNYKWTTKPSTMDYFDNVDLEKELYDLSTAPYQLFLRDMKGRLRMIHTSAPITMTTNIKQKQQSISMSLPWVEIGDASDVTIIQTPDDYGWNNDNQVLDVQLDVDVTTGELSATYPFPYNGTKFYLTGVNKETLTAKTPLGITPAQFELSETATQPDDGEVTATVKVNSENEN